MRTALPLAVAGHGGATRDQSDQDGDDADVFTLLCHKSLHEKKLSVAG
jgi:hypothetical protein